jgi:hypothetical protein
MDPVSITLIVVLSLWGLLGILVGNSTLRRQREAGEEAQRRAMLANLGASRLQQAHMFTNENAGLVDRQDTDPAVFANVLLRTLDLLRVIEEEIVVASENPDHYSPSNVQNLLSSYYVLRSFAEHCAEVASRRFGVETERPEGPRDQSEVSPHRISRDAYDRIRSADAAVSKARQRLATASTW